MSVRTVSFSRFTTFNTCQRKYRYVYIDKIKRPPASKLVFGTSSHKVQEFSYRAKIGKGKRPTVPQQKEFFAENLDQEIKRGIEYDSGDNRNYMQSDGLKIVESYEKNIAPHIKPIAVEAPFEIGFDNVDWKLIGRIDIIEKNFVSDMKFGRRKIDPFDPKLHIQLGIYKYAEQLVSGVSKKVGIHSVRRLVRSKPAEVLEVKPYMSHSVLLTHVAESVRSMENAEKSGDFPAVLNEQICSWCQYRDLCGLPTK